MSETLQPIAKDSSLGALCILEWSASWWALVIMYDMVLNELSTFEEQPQKNRSFVKLGFSTDAGSAAIKTLGPFKQGQP